MRKTARLRRVSDTIGDVTLMRDQEHVTAQRTSEPKQFEAGKLVARTCHQHEYDVIGRNIQTASRANICEKYSGVVINRGAKIHCYTKTLRSELRTI